MGHVSIDDPERLAKKMKHRYTDNHYTITWIISHESVDESEGNVNKEDDTDYHPKYCTWVISMWDMKVSMSRRVMLTKRMPQVIIQYT